jgi:hypothetical protein
MSATFVPVVYPRPAGWRRRLAGFGSKSGSAPLAATPSRPTLSPVQRLASEHMFAIAELPTCSLLELFALSARADTAIAYMRENGDTTPELALAACLSRPVDADELAAVTFEPEQRSGCVECGKPSSERTCSTCRTRKYRERKRQRESVAARSLRSESARACDVESELERVEAEVVAHEDDGVGGRQRLGTLCERARGDPVPTEVCEIPSENSPPGLREPNHPSSAPAPSPRNEEP